MGMKIIDIEKEDGGDYNISGISALDQWYRKVRTKSIDELTDGDIARFLRQRMHLRYIVPEAFLRIEKNIIAGELYDGELLFALEKLGNEYWDNHLTLKSELLKFLKSVNKNDILCNLLEDDLLVKQDVAERIYHCIKTFENDLND